MIRLLYATDPHARGNSPSSRTDDFPSTLKAKFRECWSIAQKRQCQAVIFGGDIFDSPDPDYSVAGNIAAVLRECPVPIYTIPGNHEIFGYNLSTVPRTALGFLARIGVVRLLNQGAIALSDPDTKMGVCLSGAGYHGDIDRNQDSYQTHINDLPGMWKVHVIHSMLLEKPLPKEVSHTLIRDMETDADLILASHFHAGFITQRCKNGKLCVNPGALGRVDASIAEIYRPVQVALIEFSQEGIRVEMIPLECARPGSEVLSREHIEQRLEMEDRTGRFMDLLASQGESKFLETQQIVEDIARRDALPLPVIQDSLRRISVAREALQGRNA